MKKNLFFLTLLSFPFLGNAQIFQEDFSSPESFSSWTVIDGDGLTPASSMSHINSAWVRYNRGGQTPNYGGPDNDFAAISTSWYTPAGTSNDWLISPTVTISGTNPHLIWDAKAQDGNYPDGYRVMLSTTGGNTIADFDVELFSITAEYSDWETRKIDLASYIGQSIRFAFVNNSTDQYVLLIDNILIDEYVPLSAPSCATLISPENGAVGVPYNPSIPLEWEAVTEGTVSGYNVYFGRSENQLTLLGNTPQTSVGITQGLADTTYYWQIVPINEDASAIGCPVYSLTTESSPFSPYCGPIEYGFTVEEITNVSFAGINNTTSSTSEVSHEIFLDQIGEVTQGETYEIRLSGNTEGEYYNKFHVYFDWNQNGIFDESEYVEIVDRLFNSSGTDGAFVSQNITVPADAVIGNTRMRVKKEYVMTSDLVGDSSPCDDTSYFGQAEDYTINVSPSEDLGLSEVNKTTIQVYPNPVVDFLSINTKERIKVVTITDITGKLISNVKFNSKENKVDFSDLASGVYIVKIETEKGIKSFKVIKK